MTTIVITYLFNFFVIAFVLIIWGIFILNFFRSARKDNQKHRSRRSYRETKGKQKGTWTSVSKSPGYTRALNGRNSQSQIESRNPQYSWQEMMQQNPQELYQLLRNQLPDSYEEEIIKIFNSQKPMMELMKFLRRKDIWPLFQSLQGKDQSSRQRGTQLFQNSDKTSVPIESGQDYSEAFESSNSIENDAILLNQDMDAVINEYDSYASFYETILDEIPKTSLETHSALSGKEVRATKINKKQLNKKWLRDAVIASVILEKRDF